MWYDLNGRIPFHVGGFSDITKSADYWLKFKDENYRRVALDRFSEDVYVSSVFLGLDHNYANNNLVPGGKDDPILFESMVFGLGEEQCLRARTWIDIYYMHIMQTELVIHTLSKNQDLYKPYSLSSFVFKNKIVDSDMGDGAMADRLIVDDGVSQPPISFGLFNNVFYKRSLTVNRAYEVKWWELGDPKCDIMGEVGPYLEHLKS